MAKKRFTDDLLGLFDEQPPAEVPGRETPAAAAPEATITETVEVEVPVRDRRARKKLGSKGFTQDLDDFLKEGFDLGGPRSTPRGSTPPRRRRSGLDYLIRSTVKDDEDRQPRGAAAPETKRVTLIFNKEHLAQLKAQAKERNMYLKDVVQEMVADYLNS